MAVVLSVSLVLMFGEIIPSAVFTGSEQLTMAARFSGLVGCSACRLVRVKVICLVVGKMIGWWVNLNKFVILSLVISSYWKLDILDVSSSIELERQNPTEE